MHLSSFSIGWKKKWDGVAHQSFSICLLIFCYYCTITSRYKECTVLIYCTVLYLFSITLYLQLYSVFQWPKYEIQCTACTDYAAITLFNFSMNYALCYTLEYILVICLQYIYNHTLKSWKCTDYNACTRYLPKVFMHDL